MILFFRDLTTEMKETADLKHQLKIKKHQLASLMSKMLFPKGFSGKYPDINTEFKLNEDQKAVEVMKKVIEEIPVKKKERNKKSNINKNSLKIKVQRKKNRNKV